MDLIKYTLDEFPSLFQRSANKTLDIGLDKHGFHVNLDVQQFSPEEVTVQHHGQQVIVEGKHEERPDEHGYISRHFVRKYTLPKDVDVDHVQVKLSSDGVLSLTAPKKVETAAGTERRIPIKYTHAPAVRPAAPIPHLPLL